MVPTATSAPPLMCVSNVGHADIRARWSRMLRTTCGPILFLAVERVLLDLHGTLDQASRGGDDPRPVVESPLRQLAHFVVVAALDKTPPCRSQIENGIDKGIVHLRFLGPAV